MVRQTVPTDSSTSENTTQQQPFTRTSFTWLAYLMLGYFAYLQAILGPLMPFLRAELHLNYVVGSLHVSAFALGMILAGSFGDGVARRVGRRAAFWLGGIGMAVGTLCLTLGIPVVFTIASALVMGTFGSLLVVMIQATLADKYQEQRAIALTEANVIASIGSGLAPALVGLFQRVVLGWRGALYSMVVVFLFLAFLYWRVPLPQGQQTLHVIPSENEDRRRATLPLAYWTYWIVLVCCVAVEWCIVVWSADFLHSSIGLSRDNATFTLTIFFVAEVMSRFIGSRLTRTIRSSTLLLFALAITCIGFPLYWLAPSGPLLWLNMLGLFIAGLGVANLFPFTLAVATGTAPLQLDAASARLSLGAGLAIFLAPFALGWAADNFGLQRAFTIVLVLLVMAVGATLFANRLAVRV
jgi:fucose permease